MSEKIIIDIYRKKTLDDIAEILSSKDSKLETGSSSAITALLASSLVKRGAEIINVSNPSERVEYIIRNSEKLMEYMYFLIDEDVKCRGPLKRALSEESREHIEACLQPAAAICSEIVNMMQTLLGFNSELCGFVTGNAPHYLAEAAEYSMASIKASISYIYSIAAMSEDDTFAYVTRRENEIAFQEAEKVYKSIMSGFNLPF